MSAAPSVPRIGNPEFLKRAHGQGLLSEKEAKFYHQSFPGDTLAALQEIIAKKPGLREKFAKAWGDSIGISYVSMEKTLFQPDVLALFSEEFSRTHFAIPLYMMGDAVTVAMADPSNQQLVKKIEMTVKKPVSPVFSTPGEIVDAIEIQFQKSDPLDEFINHAQFGALAKSDKVTAEQLEKMSGDKGVVEFTRGLLLLAVKERASDIHIEAGEYSARVRFRIDGVLRERFTLDMPVVNPVVSRLKIMADKDITERRRPQDGRITIKLTNMSIDFRFSTVPTIYGEKVVLRILGGSQLKDVPSLAELMLSRPIHDKLRQLITTPNGVFFVTGPTGSGKTTTLYSAIRHINQPDVNIMTIEDPVEYRLQGINQVQVNAKIDVDFASILRSFLRQDPDVILVGEIRDPETAKIASQAALTGHLVFATMHTNNALQAVTRLIEIGVEPFLVAPSIIGVMAQRLVRRLCDDCKEKYALSASEIEQIFEWDGKTGVHFWREKGCDACNGTGFNGRLAIHELFIMNAGIRGLVAKNASILDIQDAAERSGFRTLRYDGIKKVLRGLTTLNEINRVTTAEEE